MLAAGLATILTACTHDDDDDEYYDFDDINRAVDDLEHGRTIKAVLRPQEEE